MKTFASVEAVITGKRLLNVERVRDADQGFRLTFEDGTVLQVGYSGGEGTTWLNDEEVEDSGVFDQPTSKFVER